MPRQIPVPPPVTSAALPFNRSLGKYIGSCQGWPQRHSRLRESIRSSEPLSLCVASLSCPFSRRLNYVLITGTMSLRSRRFTPSTILANARATASRPDAGTTSGRVVIRVVEVRRLDQLHRRRVPSTPGPCRRSRSAPSRGTRRRRTCDTRRARRRPACRCRTPTSAARRFVGFAQVRTPRIGLRRRHVLAVDHAAPSSPGTSPCCRSSTSCRRADVMAGGRDELHGAAALRPAESSRVLRRPSITAMPDALSSAPSK